MSHGECVVSEWLLHSRRLIPLLPRLQQNSLVSTASSYYKILADQILKTGQPILKLYPEAEDTKNPQSDSESMEIRPSSIKFDKTHNLHKIIKKKRKKFECNLIENNNDASNKQVKTKIQMAEKDHDMLYLPNGYAISSKFVEGKFIIKYSE